MRGDYVARMYEGSDDVVGAVPLVVSAAAATDGREYVLDPNPVERVMGGFDESKLGPGRLVRIVPAPPLAPTPPRGLVYVESTETGELVGLVGRGSLREARLVRRGEVRVYDNGGATADRYTVVIDGSVFGMGDDPLAANGFNQYVGEEDEYATPNFGREVAVESLPEDVRRAIEMRRQGARRRAGPAPEPTESQMISYDGGCWPRLARDLADTYPDFQRGLRLVAEAVGEPVEAVWAKWQEYARQAELGDVSATMPEFVRLTYPELDVEALLEEYGRRPRSPFDDAYMARLAVFGKGAPVFVDPESGELSGPGAGGIEEAREGASDEAGDLLAPRYMGGDRVRWDDEDGSERIGTVQIDTRMGNWVWAYPDGSGPGDAVRVPRGRIERLAREGLPPGVSDEEFERKVRQITDALGGDVTRERAEEMAEQHFRSKAEWESQRGLIEGALVAETKQDVLRYLYNHPNRTVQWLANVVAVQYGGEAALLRGLRALADQDRVGSGNTIDQVSIDGEIVPIGELRRYAATGVRPPSRTPWGISDDAAEVADGVWWVTTPSHGGIWLSPERRSQVPAGVENFLGDPAWWEEDVDAPAILDALGLRAEFDRKLGRRRTTAAAEWYEADTGGGFEAMQLDDPDGGSWLLTGAEADLPAPGEPSVLGRYDADGRLIGAWELGPWTGEFPDVERYRKLGAAPGPGDDEEHLHVCPGCGGERACDEYGCRDPYKSACPGCEGGDAWPDPERAATGAVDGVDWEVSGPEPTDPTPERVRRDEVPDLSGLFEDEGEGGPGGPMGRTGRLGGRAAVAQDDDGDDGPREPDDEPSVDPYDSWADDQAERVADAVRLADAARYTVDLDERGEFRAHVDDPQGNVVYEVGSDPTTGEVGEIADGHMRHGRDVQGLEWYLKDLGIIPPSGSLRQAPRRSVGQWEPDDLGALLVAGDEATARSNAAQVARATGRPQAVVRRDDGAYLVVEEFELEEGSEVVARVDPEDPTTGALGVVAHDRPKGTRIVFRRPQDGVETVGEVVEALPAGYVVRWFDSERGGWYEDEIRDADVVADDLTGSGDDEPTEASMDGAPAGRSIKTTPGVSRDEYDGTDDSPRAQVLLADDEEEAMGA